MEERRALELKTKDDLVNNLKGVIKHLNDFISMSENLIQNAGNSIDLDIFKKMINDIKNIPEELKDSPVLIRETINFVDGIVGEVHEIRLQIENSFTSDNTLKDAVQTLDKIPTSTFRATDQILNILDELMARDAEMMDLVENICQSGGEDKKKRLIEYENLINKNQAAHFAIMDALQFQDITTQQIEHVNDLLEKTEIKLSEFSLKLRGLDEADIKRVVDKYEKRKRIYDPKAEYKDTRSDQKFADEIYKHQNLDQDDIEDLIARLREENET